MSHARSNQIAMLLADGDVLIAGGQLDLSATAMDTTAELYNPTTGTFKPTGAMTAGRAQATATLLTDGRVLVAGGFGNHGPQASAELYDPNTGAFSATGSMSGYRWGSTATLLPDGQVLMAGGLGDSGTLATTELYDATTGKFSLAGSMTAGRAFHSATLLSNGRVLMAGGYPPSGGGEVGPIVAPTAAPLSDSAGGVPTVEPGILGATVPSGALTSAELYDPATGKFSPTGSMGTMRNHPTATLLLDGRVLVAGGDAPAGPSAELYQQ